MGRYERKPQSQGRNAGPTPAAGGRTAGFTLLEMMVAIVVMGVLTAAVIVNWSSFMRHQELRGDAINLHKEILALKAKAIEEAVYVSISYAVNGNSYTINKSDDSTKWVTVKTVALSNHVKIKNPVESYNTITPGSDLLHVFSNNVSNRWQNTGIVADYKDNINTFNNGNILLTSDKVKAGYLIQKDGEISIRPEIYHCTKVLAAGGSMLWKKI